MNSQQAIEVLRKGNAAFVEQITDTSSITTTVTETKMGGEQCPFAIILGCADSRVPPEIIFDQGFGDLFVVRVAGNIVAPVQIGSIEFACQQFGAELIVVLGHTQCGAVKATLGGVINGGGDLSPNLESIVQAVSPAVAPIVSENADASVEQLMPAAGEANIKNSVSSLLDQSSVLSTLSEQDKLMVVGAEYDIQSGKVRFLD